MEQSKHNMMLSCLAPTGTISHSPPPHDLHESPATPTSLKNILSLLILHTSLSSSSLLPPPTPLPLLLLPFSLNLPPLPLLLPPLPNPHQTIRPHPLRINPRPIPLRRKRHTLRTHQDIRQLRERGICFLAAHVRVYSAFFVDGEHTVEGVAAGRAFVVVPGGVEGACYCWWGEG